MIIYIQIHFFLRIWKGYINKEAKRFQKRRSVDPHVVRTLTKNEKWRYEITSRATATNNGGEFSSVKTGNYVNLFFSVRLLLVA